MFTGAQSWLQYLVWTYMSPHMRLALETMDVITKPKASQPTTTVLCLDRPLYVVFHIVSQNRRYQCPSVLCKGRNPLGELVGN